MRTVLFFLGMFLFVQNAICQLPDAVVNELRKNPPKKTKERFAGQSINYLVMDYGKSRQRFFPGDDMKVKIRDEDRPTKALLWAVSDTSVVLAQMSEITQQNEFLNYPLGAIERIYLGKNNPFAAQAATILPSAGGGYLLMDYLGPLWNQQLKDQKMQISTSAAIVAGALVGTGLAARAYNKKSYKIRGRNRLKILKTN